MYGPSNHDAVRISCSVLLLLGICSFPPLLAAEPANLVPNGSMTEGEGLPTGWEPAPLKLKSYEKGKLCKAARDTETFLSAPASLKLTAAQGEELSVYRAIVPVKELAGKKVAFEIRRRLMGPANTLFGMGLQFEDRDGRILSSTGGLEHHFVNESGVSPWKRLQKTVFVPNNTANFVISLSLKKPTTHLDKPLMCWLDDAKMTILPSPPVTAQEISDAKFAAEFTD